MKLSILGSTGSIGTSALDVVRMYPNLFNVKVLTAANNIALLVRQIEEFAPEMVAVLDETKAFELARSLTGNCKPEILYGESGYVMAAAWESADFVLLAMVGAAGLKPALAAIEAKKKSAWPTRRPLSWQERLSWKRPGPTGWIFCRWTVNILLFSSV